MKTSHSSAALASLLVLSLAAAWFAGGCGTPSSGGSTAPKPGSGIAEYRAVVRDAHKAVAATVQSLEGLAVPAAQTSVPPGALRRFDKAFSHLELTQIKARARA